MMANGDATALPLTVISPAVDAKHATNKGNDSDYSSLSSGVNLQSAPLHEICDGDVISVANAVAQTPGD